MVEAFPDPTGYRSLVDLADRALDRAGSDEVFAFVGDDGALVAWSGEEVRRRSFAAAWRLRALGLGPGDRLLVWSPPGPEVPILYLGALRAGVLVVPLDLRMAPQTIDRIVHLADTGWLALGTGRDAPDPRDVALGQVQVRPVDWLTAAPPRPGPAPDVGGPPDVPFPPDWEARLGDWPAASRETPFLIVFTSGTTGNPKGAVLTHGNLLATVEATDAVIPHQQHRIVSLLPLSHLFGVVELYYGLHGSAPILYVRSRNPRVIFEAIRAHQVTTMVVVPQLLDLFWAALTREVARLHRTASFERARWLGRHLPYAVRRWLFRSLHEQLGGGLTLFICAAAFLPPALQEAWEEIGVVVVQGYGSTECGFATANHPGDHDPGTVGRAMPPARVRIDPADGEVQVAGPTVFQGYWRDPVATAAAFTDDGWYRTGDVGQWNSRGSLVLSGRLKDMIALPNGMKVYPEDIENALRVAGLGDTVVLETAPGRIEAVVLPPGAPALAIAPGAPTPPAKPRSAAEVTALRATVDQAVKAANASLGMHQRVVAWRFWPEPDFPRTHTLKVRRDQVRAWVQTDPQPVPATS